MSKNVLAAVVTYNRLSDLKVCVNSLRNQSYSSFDILVVNNGSSDGTKEWLATQNDLYVIDQDNLGSSGGQFSAMSYMMEHDYNWIFMMDDDGVADKDEMKELIEAYDDIKEKEGKELILNALVVDKDDYKHTSFNWARGSGRTKEVEELKKIPYFEDVHPFNGTMVNRSVVGSIGLVKKEMFIWGDEKEYMARAVHNGIGLYTVTSAIHYHPKERGVLGNVLPFFPLFKIVIKPKKFSHFFYRNEAFIYSHYPEKKSRLWLFFWAYIIRYSTHFDFAELWKFIKYFRKGLNNQYD